MSPQFVDFDADGTLDLVAGTYDGSPHLARGDGATWRQPEQILDAAGERIAIRQYWNHTTKRWIGMGGDDAGVDAGAAADGAPRGHATSAVAFDHDGDGDLDLLLGDHDSGAIWVRRNDGARGKPAFARTCERLLAGGLPVDVPGKVATMRALDWDRDGRLDLLLGSMGDANDPVPPGGGVFVLLDRGTGAPAAFAPLATLIPPSPLGALDGPSRPDAALYPDAGDVDGDGDLDLVVGGYSHWRATARPLDDAERARLDTLRGELTALQRQLDELTRAARAASADAPAAERSKRYTEAFAAQKAARDANRTERSRVQAAIDELAPPPQRGAFVWLYTNTTPRRD